MNANLVQLKSLPMDLEGLPSLGEIDSVTENMSASGGSITTESQIETTQSASFAAAAGAGGSAGGSTATTQALLSQRLQSLQQRVKSKSPPTARATAVKAETSAVSVKKTIRKGYPSHAKNDTAASDAKSQPQPWTKEEIRLLKTLVASEGVGKWQEKADKLGTGRTSKAVHTRWLRDTGRIIDLPRGQKNMLNGQMDSEDVHKQEAILEQAGYLLPMLSGSLGAAFAAHSSTAVVPLHAA